MAGDFLAVTFLAGAFLTAAFFAGAFLAGDFLTTGFLVTVFFEGVFFADFALALTTFLGAAFGLEAPFLGVVFTTFFLAAGLDLAFEEAAFFAGFELLPFLEVRVAIAIQFCGNLE
ncbi:MAG: hypothetical protein IPP71_09155 [Bacteroidetes bacterium]|nr:hypothetical protein [Bacteroidota bacterium]